MFTLVPSGSYLITASKGGYTTATQSITVTTNDITNIILTLLSTTKDTDGDGVVDSNDACPFEPAIQTTSQQRYEPGTERTCNDGVDNDCDGSYLGPTQPHTNRQDCTDNDCANTQGCQSSGGVCGDNVIQQPNSNSITEQCDGTAPNSCQAGCNLQTCQCNANTGCPQGSQCSTDADCSANNECVQCSCRAKGVCGDGQIGGSETCDVGLDKIAGTIDDIDTIARGALFNCQGICGAKGTPGACKCLISSTCGDGIVTNPPEQCDVGIDQSAGTSDDILGSCDGLGTCASDCSCVFTCKENPNAPLNLTVRDEKSPDTLTVNWQLTSPCALQRFDIYRCEGKNCTNFTLQRTATAMTIDDATVTPSTSYCYQVGAFYASGTEKKSTSACFTTKNALCSKGEFCQGNVGFACDATGTPAPIPGKDCNALSNASIGQYNCVAQNKKASCVYQSECDLCNGVLGMFYLNGIATWTDPTLNLPPQPTPCDKIATCFLDYSTTNVDKYRQCRNVSSCYDYKSDDACTHDDDTCNVGNCEWKSSPLYSEFGKGVCRPIEEDQQQCGKCNLEKGTFFEQCNREKCSLYGACYFDGKSCRQKSDLSCIDYGTNIQDCVGIDNVPGTVDAQWSFPNCDPLQQDCKKVAGTNQFTSSHDYLGLGKCEVYQAVGGPVCIKDADNNNRFGSDCSKSSAKFSACVKDFKAPTTLIIPRTAYLLNKPLFGLNSIAEVQAKDNVFSQSAGEIFTYYCFSEQGSMCYPNTTVFDRQILTTVSPGLSGNYSLRYFSEDLSGNLEEVQHLDVAVDTTPPQVRVTTAAADMTDSNGNPFTNLTITLSATDTIDAQVQCSAHLEDEDGVTLQAFNSIKGDIGTTFVRTYFNLEDGNYLYNYTCTDTAGNKASDVISMGVEEDISITNPQPKGTRGPLDPLNPVMLSVQTQTPATCKLFVDTDGAWSDAERNASAYDNPCFPSDPSSACTFSSDTAGTQHTYPMVLSPLTTGPFVFNVKCKFSDGTVKGNRNDRIIFSVDFDSPRVEPTFCANDTTFMFKPFGKAVQFCLKCVDDAANVSDNLLMPNSMKVHFKNFGCKSAQYCLNATAASCSNINLTRGKSGPIILTQAANITYSATDKGMNSRTGVIRFDVDTKAPTLNTSLSVTPNGPSQTTFGFGVYFITLTSDKPLIAQLANFTIDGMGDRPLQFISQTLDQKQTVYAITIEHDSEFRDKNNIRATFKVVAQDIYGHDVLDSFTFFLNTIPPPAPTLDPLFDGKVTQSGADFNSYPLFYNQQSDLYFTNSPTLFVTGRTLKQGTVNFYVNDRALPQATYDQSNNNPADIPLDTSTIGTNTAANRTTLLIADDFGSRIKSTFAPGNVVHFKSHEREAYGKYHLYYKIQEVRQMGPFFSELTLEDSLEKAVGLGQTIEAFAREAPASWFGQAISLRQQENLFYILFQDRNGNIARQQNEFKVIYDPLPPVVESTTPARGSTSDDQSNITIVVREPLPGSLLNVATLELKINGISIRTFRLTNETLSDAIRYYVTYDPPGPLNGSFNVSFKGNDFAMNPMQYDWSFTVDKNVPMRPNVTFRNAVFADGLWYSTAAQQFTIIFPDPDKVTLEKVAVGDANNPQAADCTMTIVNAFSCTFTQPLIPDIERGTLINDKFEVVVVGHKTLADGTISPTGTYGGYFLVIDTIPPIVNGLVDFDDYISDATNATIRVNVSNELNGLQGTINYNNVTYPLHLVAQPSDTAPYYTFRWEVPKFSKADDVEKYKPFTITVSDYTGHNASTQGQVYIDLTLPDIASFTYDILEAPVKDLAAGFFATRFTLVSVVGTFKDSDIESIYAAPGNFNLQTALYDPSAAATTALDATPPSFTLQLMIKGPVNFETMNQFTLNLRDRAGHQVQKNMAILADLKVPQAKKVTIT